MEAPVRHSVKALYAEYDVISIPEDIPELGVEKGNEGVIRELKHHPNSVTASVMVTHSTNQPKGWIDVQIKPEEKVSSYTTEI
ncbi:MAG: hypothetical protein ACFB50_04965 [Rubrobacteraceae bacterium]